MTSAFSGAPRPLGRKAFLTSSAVLHVKELWEDRTRCKTVLKKLLQNWLAAEPMSAAKFDNVNLKYFTELSSLHQAVRHDGNTYRITPYGLALMVILGVPGALKFAGHCSKAYSYLRKVYRRNADNPSIPIIELQSFLKLSELEIDRIFDILGEMSAGNLSRQAVYPQIHVSPFIRTHADMWASLAEMLPSFSTQHIFTPFPLASDLERKKDISQIGFNELLHPLIREKTLPLYLDGHYRDAVLNSVIVVYDFLRARSGLKHDGTALVSEVLSLERPRLVLSDLQSESGRNDQKGFMQIIQGMYLGIRNPKAHSLEHDVDQKTAAQYMIFVSLILGRISEATVVDSTTFTDQEANI